tara:strand:- start:559 stop:669 length:111 start_codon:yes stop_codon:yes gene_type:complete
MRTITKKVMHSQGKIILDIALPIWYSKILTTNKGRL